MNIGLLYSIKCFFFWGGGAKTNTQKSVLMVPKYTNLYHLWNSKRIKNYKVKYYFYDLTLQVTFQVKEFDFLGLNK